MVPPASIGRQNAEFPKAWPIAGGVMQLDGSELANATAMDLRNNAAVIRALPVAMDTGFARQQTSWARVLALVRGPAGGLGSPSGRPGAARDDSGEGACAVMGP